MLTAPQLRCLRYYARNSLEGHPTRYRAPAGWTITVYSRFSARTGSEWKRPDYDHLAAHGLIREQDFDWKDNVTQITDKGYDALRGNRAALQGESNE